jgi:hypothetical protein
MNWSAAEQFCNDQGGHLASFGSIGEQKDAELYFQNQGLLLPTFHTAYWLGLQSDVWPKFYWVDNVTPNPEGTAYKHWGAYVVSGRNLSEPNNLAGTETCGAGNLTQSYGQASGWADADCNLKLPFMCRIRRGWPACQQPPSPQCCVGLQAHNSGGFALRLRQTSLPRRSQTAGVPSRVLQSRWCSPTPTTPPTPPTSSTRQ